MQKKDGVLGQEAMSCPRCSRAFRWHGYRTCDDCLEAGRALAVSYGYGDPPATHEEIGRAIGVSRERVRQIEARAIARISGRIGASVDDVILSLARLGCMAGETAWAGGGGRAIVKWERSEGR